ncbi:ElyC/SanA/YdcF family protein [Inquilinus sp.]|uniref:ElyC/SanA/YdcF family protein n=1 Tax=Inquilinus sp. TaxID=1932117 RepID=UPI0031DA565D
MTQTRTIRRIACGLALLGALAGPALAYDDATESRIRTLVETGMQYYWSGGDVKKAEAEVFKGITLHGRYDVVEQAFAEASSLAPERLDFRYAIASTQIIQKKIPEAEATYQEITRHDPRATDAYAWLAALARVRGDADATALADIALAGLDRPLAERYRARFARTEAILADPPTTDVPALPGKPVILVLGYALAKDGTMQPTLLDRLDVALKAAQANPTARLIVTGGQPQAGVTEADLMTRWLVEKGVDRDRIIGEDKAKDTVGNGLNAASLIKRHGGDAVILVTSASHMRRARVVVEEALAQYGLSLAVVPAIALDAPSLEEAAKVTPDERLVVYRDLMRTSGLWAYPGLQQ